MTRLVITLNLIILSVLAVYVLNLQSVAQLVVNAPLAAHYHEQGRGTLALLNRQVRGLDEAQRQAVLTQLKPHFPYGIELKAKSSVDFSEDERSLLAQGQSVVLTRAQNRSFYAHLPQSSLVWEVPLDQSFVVDERRTAQGTVYLITQALLAHPQAQWPAIMRELEPLFGYPVSLQPLERLEMTAAEHERLGLGEVVAMPLEQSRDSLIYQRLPGSALALRLGPFEPPPFLRYVNMYLLCFLGLLLIGATLAWLWPHWRALSGLREAADAFGAGSHHVRAPHRKHSGLSAITAAFNQMAERTQRGIQAHKELTSAISHELRTPLARMRFSLEMLATSTREEERQRHINSMDQDIKELSLMLEELLTYARLDHDTIHLSLAAVPLEGWLTASLARLLPPAPKTLNWRFCAPLEASYIDPRFMRRALDNLVHNAFRHARVRVEVSLEVIDKWWVLCVEDDGEGIPEHERERLFEAFATLERSRNKAREGFGLGLAIVKRIIDAHQGQVLIMDSALGGAKVMMRWPVSIELDDDALELREVL